MPFSLAVLLQTRHCAAMQMTNLMNSVQMTATLAKYGGPMPVLEYRRISDKAVP